ncbi:hypothetical protein B0H19DRAFT_1062294 [Mycena capillaripes]|nr:hypothetical protein B0H19DRAFT_1062294 [Mycena capillaripes]
MEAQPALRRRNALLVIPDSKTMSRLHHWKQQRKTARTESRGLRAKNQSLQPGKLPVALDSEHEIQTQSIPTREKTTWLMRSESKELREGEKIGSSFKARIGSIGDWRADDLSPGRGWVNCASGPLQDACMERQVSRYTAALQWDAYQIRSSWIPTSLGET